jgi:hypothetical protein
MNPLKGNSRMANQARRIGAKEHAKPIEAFVAQA